MYQLPWDINASAFFNAHSNFPDNLYILSPVRTGTQDQANVLVTDNNVRRLPAGEDAGPELRRSEYG